METKLGVLWCYIKVNATEHKTLKSTTGREKKNTRFPALYPVAKEHRGQMLGMRKGISSYCPSPPASLLSKYLKEIMRNNRFFAEKKRKIIEKLIEIWETAQK